ncbi:isochorismatase [Kocuria dechangensis]|uniref:Isochorismatase n=1 Tax=Kocuria dechangensis TaxID=1176249 RepID=A0A917M0G4_9MICC|nr:isochorismatase family protein [Kocuria dechangensis]GGG71076.1 isochorismatase [Kocuria dechangensis]
MTAPHRALVVVDAQMEYFDGPMGIQHPPREESLANISRVVDVAAQQDMPVVMVQHEMGEESPIFAAGSKGYALHPDLERIDGREWKRVVKGYGSVFAGTDVADWLRERGVDTITIVGYMTNNCDLATAVEAEGHGFAAEILSDATGAIHLANEAGRVSAEDLHRTLMVLLQSNFAAVTTTADWVEAVSACESLVRSNLVVSAMSGAEAFVSCS